MVTPSIHVDTPNLTPHTLRRGDRLRHLEGLYRLAQWVNRDGKRPIDAKTGKAASSTDPATWSGYSVAIAYPGDGPGFVLTPDDPYTVIDLDNCRDANTGQVAPDALEIVDRFNSYTEISPSGTGLHIWIEGHIPGKRNRIGNIEMYDRGRYMTVTARPLPGYNKPIRKAQDQLEAFYAELFPAPAPKTPRPIEHNAAAGMLDSATIVQVASSARNGYKFRALYEHGDTSAYGGDDSRADAALCAMIAWYTKDPAQILEIWRSSALYRDKTDREDYAERTITAALEVVGNAGYDPAYGAADAPLIVPEPAPDTPEPDFENMTLEEIRAAWRAEHRGRVQAERTLHAIQKIMARDNMQAGPRLSLIGAALEISDQKAPNEHGYMVTAPRIARRTGQTPKTVARHLKDAEKKGAIDRHVVKRIADAEGFDSETGEIVQIGRIIQIGYIRASNVIDFADRVAGYERQETDAKHGGDRPTCPKHPEAETYTVKVTRCRECDDVLRVEKSRNAPMDLSPQDGDMGTSTTPRAPYPQDGEIDSVVNNHPKMGIREPHDAGPLTASVRGGWSTAGAAICGAIDCSNPVDHDGQRCPEHTFLEVAS